MGRRMKKIPSQSRRAIMVKHLELPSAQPLPYIRELPPIGSLPAMMRKDRLTFFVRAAQHRAVCGLHLGPIPLILFNRAEHVQSILVDHAYDFGKGQLVHKAFGGNGLFVSEGEFHRHQRKLMAPMFQPRHIAAYAETMVQSGERLQREWQDSAVVDLNSQMIALTMSIIGKTLFDSDVFHESDDLGAAISSFYEYTVHKLFSPLMPPRGWPTPRNLRYRKAMKGLRDRIHHMIEGCQASRTIRNNS